MRKVEHKVVLDHLVETYLKDRPYFKDDCWYEIEVNPLVLCNMHTDFRGYKTKSGAYYHDIYSSLIAPLIASGELEFMPQIALPESHIFCLERNGTFYVIDGSLRVFNAIQYHRKTLPAYLWQGNAVDE